MYPVKSPFAAFCKIPPTKSSAEVEVGSAGQLTVATVEIDKPRSLGARFWRSSAYALALFPGALATDAAASAFAHTGSTVVVTAPTSTPGQPVMHAPKTSTAVEEKPPHVESPVITFLRPIIVPLLPALAVEMAKGAGKDLWKRVKQKLWPESGGEKQEQPSGTFAMTLNVEETEESDFLEGIPSESQLERFVTEKPEELYRKIQSRRNSPAELYKRRRTKHSHLSFTYTPSSGSSARTINESEDIG
jgi:hypothetical protein